MPSQETFDLIIIGGGPTGLFGAFYAGLRQMRTEIVDSLEQLGGQLAALYPEKFIYDVAGYPAVLARTLVGELVKQAMQARPALALGERVERLHRREDGVLELTTDSTVHRARTVLIAAGGGAFTPKRLPDPQVRAFEGRGVVYGVRDPLDYREKCIVVIGGGDAAVDWALALSRVAASVTLVHRRDIFRAHEESVARLSSSPIVVKPFCELKHLHGAGALEAATIVDTRTRQEERLDADAVIVSIGFLSTLGPIQNWGLLTDREGIIVGPCMETNIPGVFAAGDIASYPGKLRLIATGFGEAATAVNHAKVFLQPEAKAFPGHSTTLVPKLRKAAGRQRAENG